MASQLKMAMAETVSPETTDGAQRAKAARWGRLPGVRQYVMPCLLDRQRIRMQARDYPEEIIQPVYCVMKFTKSRCIFWRSGRLTYIMWPPWYSANWMLRRISGSNSMCSMV